MDIENTKKAGVGFTIEILKQLRDDYKNEIPSKLLRSLDKDNKYKVRKEWFTLVVFALSEASERGFITDENISKEVQDFKKWAIKGEFKEHTLTTPEDIEKANKVIDLVLNSLGANRPKT